MSPSALRAPPPYDAGLSGENQLTLLWPPPSYGGGARRVEGDRISRGDCNIRTSRYIECFGISCREKIEVVERPPPVPLRPCGPPPPCAPQKALRWGRAKIPESATPRPPANHQATRLEPTSPDFSPDSPADNAAGRLDVPLWKIAFRKRAGCPPPHRQKPGIPGR